MNNMSMLCEVTVKKDLGPGAPTALNVSPLDHLKLTDVDATSLKWWTELQEAMYSEAVKKANRIGTIKRNFTDTSKETIISLYKSLVRPHIVYCRKIWSHHYDKDIKFIESV